jgi:site-specific DNA-methyltransferase (adenine-specific)
MGGTARRQPGRPAPRPGGRAARPSLGKNPGDVWRIASRGFRGAHFATFPPELVRRPILATCPALACSHCGKACGPATSRDGGPVGPACRFAAAPRPGIVLDPFFGTGTVGLVARELGRDWLGIELKAEDVKIARQRLGLEAAA